MFEFQKLQSGLMHINHACLLIKRRDEYILCDPWFISPAFHNWTQNPSPPVDLIRFILGIDKDKLIVVTSHGHDDHVDDYFITHHLRDCRFCIPTFRSPGLQRRIEGLTGKPPAMLSDEPTTFGRFALSRIVNGDFTNFDSIINIETDDFTVIHANDNWHEQPDEVIGAILALKSRSRGLFYYLSQVGIADCFPQCYPQFSDSELQTITYSRLETAIRAADSNMKALSISRLYSYANQSRIISEFAKQPFDGFRLVREMIDAYNREHETEITQLMPGNCLDLGRGSQTPADTLPIADSLLEFCLRRLENKANSYIKGAAKPGPLRFRITDELDQVELSDPGVIYATNRVTWQRILTGMINLEAISIGGGGLIVRVPREFNIQEIHHGIGNFGYIAQNNFRTGGLSWLLNE
jgi:hypothetical protein